jgi:hypothetical protein
MMQANPELLNFALGALVMLTLVLLAVVIGAWRVVAWLWSKVVAANDIGARRQGGVINFSGNIVDVFGPPRSVKAQAPKKKREQPRGTGERRVGMNGAEGHA